VTKNSITAWARTVFSFPYQGRVISKDEICTWIDGEWIFSQIDTVGVADPNFKILGNPLAAIKKYKEGYQFMFKDGTKFALSPEYVCERVVDGSLFYICQIPSVYDVYVNFAKISVLACFGMSFDGKMIKMFNVENLGSEIYIGISFVLGDMLRKHDSGSRNPVYAPADGSVVPKIDEVKILKARIEELEAKEKFAPYIEDTEDDIKLWEQVQKDNLELKKSMDELKLTMSQVINPLKTMESMTSVVVNGQFKKVTRGQAHEIRFGNSDVNAFVLKNYDDTEFENFRRKNNLMRGFPMPDDVKHDVEENAPSTKGKQFDFAVKTTPLEIQGKRMKFDNSLKRDEVEEE